jgi:hypothetical protein
MIINVFWPSCKVSFSDFNKTGILNIFSKNAPISNTTKMSTMGAELFHADGGWTDMTRQKVAFQNFVKAIENA